MVEITRTSPWHSRSELVEIWRFLERRRIQQHCADCQAPFPWLTCDARHLCSLPNRCGRANSRHREAGKTKHGGTKLLNFKLTKPVSTLRCRTTGQRFSVASACCKHMLNSIKYPDVKVADVSAVCFHVAGHVPESAVFEARKADNKVIWYSRE